MQPRWLRTRPLDGAGLVDEVNERTGWGLRFQGYCVGGQVGACFASYPDGRQVVVSWWPGEIADRMSMVRRVLSRLWEGGYPAPRYEAVVDCSDGIAVLQTRVTGDRIGMVSLPLTQRLVRLNEARCAVFDEPEGSLDDLYLTDDGPGFCLHRPLREYSRETARLLDWIEGVGRTLQSSTGPGADAVHGDFHPGNVLLRPGTADDVVAVLDWTGAYVGDAGKDLIDLTFACDVQPASPEARTYLHHHVVNTLDADRLAAFCAHQSLRIVDWSIRHFAATDVERWLDVAHQWQVVAEN